MKFGDFDRNELHQYLNEHLEPATRFNDDVMVLSLMSIRYVALMAYNAGVRHEKERQGGKK